MGKFTFTVPTSNIINERTVVLENYQIRLFIHYDLSVNRWVLDIENQTLGKIGYGVVMNQGTDLLNAYGLLDLQALVLLNITSVVGLEADTTNLGRDLVMVYMDLDTYQETILDDAIGGRSVYRSGL